jgi:MoaA/NifB/PqqE/SkfB family radical SAM enzyme
MPGEVLHKNDILTVINRKPSSIGLELTTRCPLHCVYCRRAFLDYKDQDLSFEIFQELHQKLINFKRVVVCGIGEPAVYCHLYEVTSELRQKVAIITSGTVPIDFSKLNQKHNIEMIIFSVDAPDESIMNSITGGYNWSNLLQNLETIRKIPTIFRMINCTINEYNVALPAEVVLFAAKNKLQAISFELPIGDDDFLNTNKDKIKFYLDQAQQTAVKNNIFMDSPYRLKCVIREHVVPYMNIKGDLFPCCFGLNIHFKIGNLFEQEFDEIWQGPKYQQFLQGDLCLNQCSIYRNKIDFKK